MSTGDLALRPPQRGRTSQSGGSYLLLLVAVAAVGVVAAHALQTGEALRRRVAEHALLDAGAAWEAALVSHGARPRTVEELLRDPRFPGVRRHLRRVPIDPLTGQPTWGLLRDPQGGIVGVFSLADGTPHRREGFTGARRHFNSAGSYRDWTFGAPPHQSLRIDSTSERNSRL